MTLTVALEVSVLAGAAGEIPDGEIGGNRILVTKPSWMLDYGTRFSQAGRYFGVLRPQQCTRIRQARRAGLHWPLDGTHRQRLAGHR